MLQLQYSNLRIFLAKFSILKVEALSILVFSRSKRYSMIQIRISFKYLSIKILIGHRDVADVTCLLWKKILVNFFLK
jgi:hypothetical protein